MTNKQAPQKQGAAMRPFLKLLHETKPSYLLLALALGLSIISTLVGLVIPMFTKNLVDGFSLASVSKLQIRRHRRSVHCADRGRMESRFTF